MCKSILRDRSNTNSIGALSVVLRCISGMLGF
jgi:hypothetical protein